jgi:hypothetical protein
MSRLLAVRSWVPALAAVLLATLTPGSAGAIGLRSQASSDGTALGVQAYPPLRVTTASQVTRDDPVPGRTYSEPSMLVDPDNPKVIVASAVEMRTRICYLMRSTDGGASWETLPALPGTNAFPDCFTVNGGQTQSPLAWGRNHTLYYGLLGYNQADGGNGRTGNISVLLARSTDLGNSWNTVIVDNSRGKTGDQVQNDSPVASVAVDSHSASQDIVYIGWNQSFPNSKSPDSPTLVATSTDGGQTFGTPVNMSKFYTDTYTDSDGTKYNIGLGTPFLAVGPNGTLYAVAGAAVPFSVNVFPPLPLLSAMSTDRGHTWTVQKFTDASHDISQPILQTSTQGGPAGTLLVVYQNKLGTQVQGSEDIYFQRSTDGAKTWTQPVRLNDDDPANQTYHFMPNIGVAPNGRIDVAWYDFRDAKSFENDVYYTYSTNNGTTWAKNIRVTDQSVNRTFGPNARFDIRIPPGVASTNDLAAVGWSDTRLGTPDTQTQDVFAAVVQYKPIVAAAPNRTLRYLAAAAAGLVVAGAIVLVVAFRRRRQDVEPPRASKAREPEPVGAP